jgi:hypothetical protein
MSDPGRRCRYGTAAALVLAVLAAASGGPAEAETKGRIGLKARVEPADLAPGGKGTVVVTGELGDLMVFADGEAALAWRSVAAPGVTWGTPETPVTYATKPDGVEMTTPAPRKDDTEAPTKVWEGRFELRVPVQIARDAAPGTTLALLLAYGACDAEVCYARQKDQRAAVTLGAPAEPVVGEPLDGEPARAVPIFPVVEGEPLEKAETGPLAWTAVDSVDRLRQEVDAAKAAGKPVVVAPYATWCKYCQRYVALVDETSDLREGFAHLVRLRLDVTDDPRTELRAALGMGPGQPQFVFLDREGQILRGLRLEGWKMSAEDSARALRLRLVRLLAGD